MLAVALVLILVVGCMWMESRSGKASVAAALALPFMVEVDGDGVTLRKGASMTAWMRWEDIRAVRAFKVDCYGYDTICIAVESMVEGAGFVANAEAFEERLPEFDGQWFQNVEGQRPRKQMPGLDDAPPYGEDTPMLSTSSELAVAQVLWTLQVIANSDLPEIGTKALAAGVDTPSIRVLAGSEGEETRVLVDLFRRALEEVGLPSSTPTEAIRRCAVLVSQEIVEGSVSPIEGARRIIAALRSGNVNPSFHELDPFAVKATAQGNRKNTRWLAGPPTGGTATPRGRPARQFVATG